MDLVLIFKKWLVKRLWLSKIVIFSFFIIHNSSIGQNLNVREENGQLILTHPDGTKRKFKVSSDLLKRQKYEIKIKAAPKKPVDDIEILLFKANSLFHQKKYHTALELVRRAEEMDPKDARAKTMKGSLYHILGWQKKAIEAWKLALRLNPKQKNLKKFLDEVKQSQ